MCSQLHLWRSRAGLVVFGDAQLKSQIYMDSSSPNSVSLFWQLPQYFFISVAEILVCIPALELAYDESPVHLRSFVTSLWYISQALGNLVDVVLFLALANLQTWILFYLFTGIMLVATIYYCFHIHGYTYVASPQSARTEAPEKVSDVSSTDFE